jgi:integrase
LGRSRVVGMLRVQEIVLSGGRRSWTIVWPDGVVHAEADGYLRGFEGEPGTQRTYAFLLVDHLRWLEREALSPDSVTLRDLERYMGLVGAEVRMPLGEPWRLGRRPYGRNTLSTAASVLKAFYFELAGSGRNAELGRRLDRSRLPSRADRDRALLGHVKTTMPANPLAPRRNVRRHPKMLPDDARGRLLAAVSTARDRLVVTWLYDGGFRIGELCGLHLADLHLREGAECAQARAAHAHICHHEGNPNQARAKAKHPWEVVGGVVCGGLIRRVSPAMVHAYFEYMTAEYPHGAAAAHGMLLVQLAGDGHGQPWAPAAARGMLRRAGNRAGLGRVHPHQARHNFASAVLDASGGNLMIARDAGGWTSASTVDAVYGHSDIHDLAFDAALRRVWGEQP